MNRQPLPMTLVLALIFVATDSSFAQRNKSEPSWPTMGHPAAYKQLPAELKSLAPFETDHYFATPDSENREQLYFRTLLFFSSNAIEDWFEDPILGQQIFRNAKLRSRRKKSIRYLASLNKIKRKCSQS